MGLERLASVLQGVPTNYDTDLFTPIQARMRELLGHDPDAFESERFSYQVIADHSRAITFLIADGVLPANEGRGYVLRRIVRRAVRHGRLLGRREPFLAETATVVIDTMGDAYPVLRERRDVILGTIVREETAFARTLDAGTIHLEEALIPLTGAERVVGRSAETLPADAPVLAGEIAFRLHDTYGFPIDLTVELAAEYGVRVDRAGFEVALEEQRDRSRSGRKADLSRQAELTALYDGIARRDRRHHLPGLRGHDGRGPGAWPSCATGPSTRSSRPGPRSSCGSRPAAAAELVLDRTPFYAEGGGQVGDQGQIRDAATDELLFTRRGHPAAGRRAHRPSGQAARAGRGRPAVRRRGRPGSRRARTMRNHTGTHVLHRALRNTVGESARQAGSLVTPGLPALRLPVRPAAQPTRSGAPSRPRCGGVVRDDLPVACAAR